MRSLFSKINVPTAVAVMAFIAFDRYFDATGTVFRTIGLTPRR